jgi:hypothetical protein
MIEGLAARWLFTAVFAVAGLGAALPRRARAEWGRSADRLPAVLCATMCAALIAMTWRSEPAAATWLQVAVFGCAALRLALASPARSSRGRRPGLPALLHALMAGAMIWMLTAMPAAAGIRPDSGAMVSMSRAATPAAVVVVSILLAVSCAAASIPWLARAVGPGPRVNDPVSASQAVMSAGMAAMLFATL